VSERSEPSIARCDLGAAAEHREVEKGQRRVDVWYMMDETKGKEGLNMAGVRTIPAL